MQARAASLALWLRMALLGRASECCGWTLGGRYNAKTVARQPASIDAVCVIESPRPVFMRKERFRRLEFDVARAQRWRVWTLGDASVVGRNGSLIRPHGRSLVSGFAPCVSKDSGPPLDLRLQEPPLEGQPRTAAPPRTRRRKGRRDPVAPGNRRLTHKRGLPSESGPFALRNCARP